MNWKLLISECIAAGMSQAEIAKQIGVTQSAISHVLKGSQKGFLYEPGKKLIDLHRRVRGGEPSDPMNADSSDDVQPPAGTADKGEGM